VPPTAPADEDPAVPTDFPALPTGQQLPTIPEIAALVASTLPADAQAAATATLADEILPWDLRNLAGHPNQRTLIELVYEKLARELGADRAARPERLGNMLCLRRGERLIRRVHGLAVARYVRDRGGKTPSGAEPGDTDPAAPFLGLSDPEFDAAVGQARADLKAWQDDARAAHPSCLERQRVARIHDGLALDSAASGNFAAAAGALYVFLRSVGERPRQIDVH